MFDGVEVDLWICIASITSDTTALVEIDLKPAPDALVASIITLLTAILHHGHPRRGSKLQDCSVSHEAE